jgi:hypothetical protein
MGAEGIFLQVGEELVTLEQTAYKSEDLLQSALARHPEVIAGPTTDGEQEARLLLITREMGVPAAPVGGSSFSLDHLFIDDAGVPVLVEVKRSTDTRIRREVIGQMLDYAANAVLYWPLRLLHESLAKRAAREGTSVDELLASFRPDLDPEDFWEAVESNLRLGRIRMIFVADQLPAELIRVIEFLNEQMSPAEVLGVELRQFKAGEHIAYVPRVVGQTAAAAQVKSSGAGQAWTRDSFLEAARGRCSVPVMAFIERLLAHCESSGGKLTWGRGDSPGVSGWYPVQGRLTGTWVLNANTDSPTTKAYLVFYYGDIVSRTGPELIESSAAKLEQIPHLRQKIGAARASGWRKYPSLYLPDVAGDTDAENAVFEAVDALADSGSAPPPGLVS